MCSFLPVRGRAREGQHAGARIAQPSGLWDYSLLVANLSQIAQPSFLATLARTS